MWGLATVFTPLSFYLSIFQEHLSGSCSFSFLLCSMMYKNWLFFSVVQQNGIHHCESKKSALPWGTHFLYFLSTKEAMAFWMLSASLPPGRQERKVFNCQFIINVKWPWKIAFLRHIRITHGVVLTDWIFWKSSGYNGPQMLRDSSVFLPLKSGVA